MDAEKLDGLLFDLGCDDGTRRLLVPLFKVDRLPRGMAFSIRQGTWRSFGIISSGYVCGYFRHAFEEYMIGVLGPGIALPPLNYRGDFPVDILLEPVTRIELYTLDIGTVSEYGHEHCQAVLQLLMKSYEGIFGQLLFWDAIGHLPRGEGRFKEFAQYGGHLLGKVPDAVLASATRMSRRHFVRFKNR